MARKAKEFRKRKGGPPFVQLYRFVKRSQAWHGLSLYARCLLIELLDRYTGCNNGLIGLGVREASKALRCSHGSTCKAMRELDDSGLAQPLTPGSWRGKKATEWRITFYVCNKTGELPIKSWPEVTWESAKGHVGKHKGGVEVFPRSRGKAQTPKNSISDIALRSRGEAHIESNQGVGKLPAASLRAAAEVSLTPAGPIPKAQSDSSNNFAISAEPELAELLKSHKEKKGKPTEGPSPEPDPRMVALTRWGRAAAG
jgi:hypothetical protein